MEIHYRFGSTVRVSAAKQVPLWLRQRTLPEHENEEISFNIWDILKNMEDFFPCHSFFPRTCVRGAKAKLAFRTPEVHPDDVLCARFGLTIRNMRE